MVGEGNGAGDLAAQHFGYDVFISYASADDADGWVSGFRDALVADFQAYGSPLNVFFSSESIETAEDWETKILASLLSSKVLVVCQSPAYYAAEWCQREWEEFRKRHLNQEDSVTVVYFVELPGSDPEINQAWRDEVSRTQHVDFRDFFTLGVAALQTRQVRQRIQKLGLTIADRLDRVRLAWLAALEDLEDEE